MNNGSETRKCSKSMGVLNNTFYPFKVRAMRENRIWTGATLNILLYNISKIKRGLICV